MGSTGSGRFTDYSNSGASSGNAASGGTSGENKCERAFSSDLEDIERCSFYIANQDVPALDSAVNISFDQRLIVVDTNGLVLGNLPTKFNYLLACLKDGKNFSGVVSASSNIGVAMITVDVIPIVE